MCQRSVWFLILFQILFQANLEHAVEGNDVPPNFLLITADNLGYGDLTCFNSASSIKSPCLDRLASQGAKLTAFYTPSPTCTVSRACLLTGRIPKRHGLHDQLKGIQGNYGEGLSHTERLLPQYLQTSPTRYATGCFGKWNIGFAKGSRPTERGFDEFVGHASGNMDYYDHNYNGVHDLFRGTKHLQARGKYSTDLFAEAAIDFIRRMSTSQTPWLCYLPFNAPHFPNAKNKKPGRPNNWQAPDEAFDMYGLSPKEPDPKKRYAAVVTALDSAIGRVLQALDEAGVANNTFVFFMSDNGAFKLGRKGLDVGDNNPLRGGGVTCWEGGIRVAALARWPGKIQPGGVISEPFWSPDILMACVRLAGATLPSDTQFDGKDPIPLLTEKAPTPHESLLFDYRSHAALRMGDWKIVRESPQDLWQLFNVRNDPGEIRNLAETAPGRVARLEAEFHRWEQ